MTQQSITPVLEQHAEQGAFLWLLRDRTVFHPQMDLRDLVELDDRIDAHLEGLSIAGERGWATCVRDYAWADPGEVFVASVLATESGSAARFEVVLEIASRSYELSRGLVSALGWLALDEVVDTIVEMLASSEPALRRMGVAAAAAHRHDLGPALSDALNDEDASVRARALKAVGELGRIDLLPAARRHLRAEDPWCRFQAASALALHAGDAEALQVLRETVEADAPGGGAALDLVIRRAGPADAMAWLSRLAADDHLVRTAVVAAGVAGYPGLVPWLIERMADPTLARPAGQAFEMITGVDRAHDGMEAEAPDGYVAGPSDDPEDPDVEIDPDEGTAWPDPDDIRRWWQDNETRFQTDTRHLLGQPLSAEPLHQVLRRGKQRQRAAAALELAILQPGTPLFELRAPGFRQQRLLGLV